MTSIIAVKHNIEVAHRLYENLGKCEQIHGHSMNVTLRLGGELDSKGFVESVEFGALKKDFRGYLDSYFDHRLLLNAADPFAGALIPFANEDGVKVEQDQVFLPGLQTMIGDPTTELIAKEIHTVVTSMGYPVWEVEVWETAVNMASYVGGN